MSERPIRFGVMADGVRTPGELISLAQWAEVTGFSTVLIRDHVVEHTFGHQLGPLAAMTLAAAHTTSLRIGTLVICNDFRPPVQLAKEIATLDVASGGRIELGLGAGFLQPEYAPLGLSFDPPGVRVSRLEESVQLYKLLFTGKPVTFNGEHYSVQDFRSFPVPIQPTGIPILIAGSGERMLKLAAREANTVGIQTAATTSSTVDDPTNRFAEAVQRKVDIVQATAGNRFPQIELNTTISIEVTDDRESGARRIITQRGWIGVDVDDVLQMPGYLIGSLPEIADQVRRRRDRFGLSYLVVSQAQSPLIAPIVAELTGT